jgi:hypothetical protein
MAAPPPDSRGSEWHADLEELADLAAETVAPDQVAAARRRRSGWSAGHLAALLTAGPSGAEAATPSASSRPVGPRRPPRRRLLGSALAVAGAAVLCIAALQHLPSADSTSPLTSGPGPTTPSPDSGSGAVALQPVPLDPSAPAPLVTPAPFSSPASGAGAVQPPGQGGVAPAPRRVTQAPAGPAPQGPPPPMMAPVGHPIANPPTAQPAPDPTAPPTAAATATPSPSPSATPAPALAVRSVSLSMGTCENRGPYWVCPETATFTFAPGAQGTLSYAIAGTATTCSGTSSAFSQPQPSVNIPPGTTRAVVTSALVFPASAHPGPIGPGRTASTATVKVTSPNRLSSASEAFGGASCP